MEDHKKKSNNTNQRISGGIYGLGWIGATIYYISYATSFWSGVLGILKALIWPVFLVYKLFEHLGM